MGWEMLYDALTYYEGRPPSAIIKDFGDWLPYVTLR